MFDIIKTIEKKTNSFSNKLNTGIKEKILANEIPRTVYLLSYIIWLITSFIEIFFEGNSIYKPIYYMLLATTLVVFIPYTSLKKSTKRLSVIGIYAISILLYIAKYIIDKKEITFRILDLSLSLEEVLMWSTLLVLIVLFSNARFTLADEAFKQNLLTSFKYSFIICFILLFVSGMFLLADTKIYFSPKLFSIATHTMLLVESTTLYVIEKKFEKGLKCDEDEDEE